MILIGSLSTQLLTSRPLTSPNYHSNLLAPVVRPLRKLSSEARTYWFNFARCETVSSTLVTKLEILVELFGVRV